MTWRSPTSVCWSASTPTCRSNPVAPARCRGWPRTPASGVALETIAEVRRRGGRLILVSHLGRPAGRDPQLLMRPVAEHPVAEHPDTDAQPRALDGVDVPDGWIGLDIGLRTAERYTREVTRARTAFWNGATGRFELAGFSDGTRTVAEALAACPALEHIRRACLIVMDGWGIAPPGGNAITLARTRCSTNRGRPARVRQ